MTLERRRPGSLVAAGTAVIAVTYGLIRFGYGLYLPTFTAEYGLSTGVAGGIAAGSFAGYCASALLAQWLIRLGRPREALWTACALATVGALVTAAAWSVLSLAVGVVVAGSAAGAASPALVVAVAATVRGPRADRSQAVVNSGTGVGVVAGGLLAAALAGQWRLLWVGFALAAVSVTWWADRRTAWSAPLAAARAAGSPLRQDIAPLRPALLAALLAGAGSAAVWTFGRDLLTTAGAPAATTALLWSVLGGAGIVGALSGDLVRRLGPHATWAATAVVLASATTVLVVLPDRVLPAAVALAGFGASYVVLSGVLISYATGVTPQREAESTAALFVALTAGQALGAAALGAIASATSLTASFLGAAALILLSIVPATRRTG
jgi:predicted MFS family arabinose efflux permease